MFLVLYCQVQYFTEQRIKVEMKNPLSTLTNLRAVSSNGEFSPMRKFLAVSADGSMTPRGCQSVPGACSCSWQEMTVLTYNLCASSTDFKYLVASKCFANNCYIMKELQPFPPPKKSPAHIQWRSIFFQIFRLCLAKFMDSDTEPAALHGQLI